MVGTMARSPSIDGRALLDRADREDRDLRRIEDCDELLDAVHPEVRDGERPALEIGELELPVACARHDVRAIRGDLLDGLLVGVADDRHDEPARRRDCEADVCRSEAVELPVDEVRVDGAMAHERRRDDAREHVGDGRLRLTLAEQLDHALARCDELGRIRGDGELEDRSLPRLRETAGDRLARGRELDDLDVGGGRSAGRSRRRPGRGVLDVLGDDAAFWPRAGDLPDVDASLARDPPREWARLHVLAGRARRRG